MGKEAQLFLDGDGDTRRWYITTGGSGHCEFSNNDDATMTKQAIEWFKQECTNYDRLVDQNGREIYVRSSKDVNDPSSDALLTVDETPPGNNIVWHLSYKGETHTGSEASIPEATARVKHQWRDLFPYAKRLMFNGNQMIDEASDSHRLRQVAAWLKPFGGVPSVDLAIEDLNRIADELENR